MAANWTGQDRLAAQAWFEANDAFFVHTYYYREGIKDQDGKPVYGTVTKYKANTNEPVLDEESQPVTFWGRTFTLVQSSFVDPQEIAFALAIWGRETERTTDPVDDAEAAIYEALSAFMGRVGTFTQGSSPRTRAEIEAYVIANTP